MRNTELVDYAKQIQENCKEGCKAENEETRCPFAVETPNQVICKLSAEKPITFKL